MKLLDRLDRIVRPIAIPNLTEVLLVGQVAMLLATLFDPTMAERSMLVWARVFEGEVWRLVTFFFFPPALGIFVIFYFYLFMLMGKAMENYWGSVRYNTYFYLGALLTLLSGLVLPEAPITGAFFQATVLLAFATVNPDYELMVMLVLPVKIKWIAMLQGISYLLALASGVGSVRLMVLASIGNYLIFFGGDGIKAIGRVKHRAKFAGLAAQEKKRAEQPRHRCAVCGIDSKTNPFEDFRYCSKCDGEHAYCEKHLRNHEHVASN